MTIQQKISIEELTQAQASIQQASGLPNAAYADPDVFEFERDNVFAKTWTGLDFASELPTQAYAKPVDFMGLPLLLVRDREDNIKVFHNVCSHRGMVLVDEPGPVKKLIRCRYHSWSYDLQGELKSTPHIGGVGTTSAEGFSCEGNGLKEVRSAIWMGIIFVNLSGQAQSFEDYILPLKTRWEAFTGEGAFEQLEVADDHSNMRLDINCNWKLAIENYCEAYHLPWVHPDLNSYSPLEQHVNLLVNDYMSGQGTLNYTHSEVSGHTLPKFPNWPDQKLNEGEYISLFPNLMLGLQVDHVFAIVIQPTACDRIIEKLQITYVNKASAKSDDYAGCREAVMKSWDLVFKEDIFAIEGMQQGRNSPGFKGGVFSPVMDESTHVFHCWVAKQYQHALEADSA